MKPENPYQATIVDAGDHFVVLRGEARRSQQSPLDIMMGETWKSGSGDVEYSEGHKGTLYRCVAVSGPLVAAEVVVDGPYKSLGAVEMINATLVEIWPVTPQFAVAVVKNRGDRPKPPTMHPMLSSMWSSK